MKSASAVPAALIGLEKEVGRLAPGLRADIVTLDAELAPVRVMRAGRWMDETEGAG